MAEQQTQKSEKPEQGDLFEPGFGYHVRLPVFDGPLDLLLYLIRKHRIDIYDIPIALITDEYLRYIEHMQDLDIDLAGDFLVMAATLMHIKSQMLLPRPEEDEEEEGEDPRAELVRMLLEYQSIKEAARQLGTRALLDRDVFTHTPHPDDLPDPEDGGIADVDLVVFLKAFRKVIERKPVEAHKVREEVFHLRDRILGLAERLQSVERLTFDEIFETDQQRSRPWLIVTFLAILELVRMKMLKVSQAETGGDLYILPQPTLSPDAVDLQHVDSFGGESAEDIEKEFEAEAAEVAAAARELEESDEESEEDYDDEFDDEEGDDNG